MTTLDFVLRRVNAMKHAAYAVAKCLVKAAIKWTGAGDIYEYALDIGEAVYQDLHGVSPAERRAALEEHARLEPAAAEQDVRDQRTAGNPLRPGGDPLSGASALRGSRSTGATPTCRPSRLATCYSA
ncbi:MAG: hypothetical protein ACRC1K_24575 [Planctomycetia bacterium]